MRISNFMEHSASESMYKFATHGLANLLIYAPIYRAVERNYFNPDFNPFVFAAGYTVFTDIMRTLFSHEHKFSDDLSDNSGVFIGAAAGYLIAAKFFG